MGVPSESKMKSVPVPDQVREYFRAVGAMGGKARVAKGAAMLSVEERRAAAMRMVEARRKKRAEENNPVDKG